MWRRASRAGLGTDKMNEILAAVLSFVILKGRGRDEESSGRRLRNSRRLAPFSTTCMPPSARGRLWLSNLDRYG